MINEKEKLLKLVDKAIVPLMEISTFLWENMANRLDIEVNAGKFVWVSDKDPQWVEKTAVESIRKETIDEDNKRFLGYVGEDEEECEQIVGITNYDYLWTQAQNELRQELRDKIKGK